MGPPVQSPSVGSRLPAPEETASVGLELTVHANGLSSPQILNSDLRSHRDYCLPRKAGVLLLVLIRNLTVAGLTCRALSSVSKAQCHCQHCKERRREENETLPRAGAPFCVPGQKCCLCHTGVQPLTWHTANPQCAVTGFFFFFKFLCFIHRLL